MIIGSKRIWICYVDDYPIGTALGREHLLITYEQYSTISTVQVFLSKTKTLDLPFVI